MLTKRPTSKSPTSRRRTRAKIPLKTRRRTRRRTLERTPTRKSPGAARPSARRARSRATAARRRPTAARGPRQYLHAIDASLVDVHTGFIKKNNNGRGTCEASCPADKAYKCYKKPDEDEVADRDGGDGACKDDSGWEKHPAKKGKTLDCDWVKKSPKKRCKKKNKGGTKASKACACACA
jgi:hypothetical protein